MSNEALLRSGSPLVQHLDYSTEFVSSLLYASDGNHDFSWCSYPGEELWAGGELGFDLYSGTSAVHCGSVDNSIEDPGKMCVLM